MSDNSKQRERSLNISSICSCLWRCTTHRKAWKYLIRSDLSHPAIETPPAPLRYSSGTLKTEDRILRVPKRSNGARFVPNALTMFVRVKARTIRMCKECWCTTASGRAAPRISRLSLAAIASPRTQHPQRRLFEGVEICAAVSSRNASCRIGRVG
jgi:hypothetical protein